MVGEGRRPPDTELLNLTFCHCSDKAGCAASLLFFYLHAVICGVNEELLYREGMFQVVLG